VGTGPGDQIGGLASGDGRGRELSPTVRLRPVVEDDIAVFAEHQLDPEAAWMVAFTSEGATDPVAFAAKWRRILADDALIKRTIEVDGLVAGNMLKFDSFGQPEVGYWLGRRWWGRGVATSALGLFLAELLDRPLYAVVAADNVASLRVLEKRGFTVIGSDRQYSRARGTDVDQVVLRLGEET
jgi:RimJ/RimL family protein N-acetyltransferase